MRALKLLLIPLGLLLVVALVFVWTLPADVAVRYGAHALGPVALSGVRGTAWDGHADGVSVFGRDLGELDWHARKLPLLGGRLVADLRIKGADVDAAGEMTRAANGAIVAHDLRFSIPAQLLAPALDMQRLSLLGTINGTLESATLTGALLSDVKGNARWSEAGVSGDAEARFSDILVDFASQPDTGVVGKVHDDGRGNLAVDGSFKILFNTFDAEATLHARNNDRQVAETLRYVGQPQPDGSSKFTVHGSMLKVF